MNLLQKRIQEASQKYYSGEGSDVSDVEFDNMMEQLKEEDPNNELLTQVGHGYNVNKDTTPGEKVRHKYGTIGSLDKCHNWKEYPSYMRTSRDIEHASLKLDGISVVLYYEEGKLVKALTRGSNNIGVDITEFAAYILKNDVTLYDFVFTGAVRGEIVMSYNNFDKFKQIHPDAENPRNSTAGLKNSNKITPDLDFLDIVVYSVVGVELANDWFTSYSSMIKWLNDNFTHVVKHETIMNELDEHTFLNTMDELKDKWYGEYPADGIVITLDHLKKVNKEIAYTAIAFKFKAESAVTEVIGIEWNLSKTKYLIPRIELETVRLSGTNVSWCTGHNAQYIADNKIGPGAEVEVYKSGEIIPYLDKVIVPSEFWVLPTTCPCCGTNLETVGVHLMCPNRECADFNVQDLLVWMENIAPYDGLGDTLKLKFLLDMFGEDMSVDEIYAEGPITFPKTGKVKLDDFHTMYNQLFTNKVKLVDAIRALNIPRFGEVTSRKLADYPEQVMTLMYAAANPSIRLDSQGFEKMIGNANCKSLIENYHKFNRLNYIKDNIIWEKPKVDNGKVAITGKLSVKRSIFEEELRTAGYTPGNISKDTKYLITDDPNSSSEKNKKADKYGIVKLTEGEFREHYMQERKM